MNASFPVGQPLIPRKTAKPSYETENNYYLKLKFIFAFRFFWLLMVLNWLYQKKDEIDMKTLFPFRAYQCRGHLASDRAT